MTIQEIYIKKSYTIIGRINSDDIIAGEFSIIVGDISVKLVLDTTDKRIDTFHKIQVSEEMYEALMSEEHDGSNLSIECKNELSHIVQPSSKAIKKLLLHIKYDLYQTGILEQLYSVRPQSYWSENNIDWKIFPIIITARVEISNSIRLTSDKINLIQENINNSNEPFYSLIFLHKSKKANYPNDRLLYAAIAVELAIREFIVWKIPDFHYIILRMQSPPLDQMYHNVLESIGENPSPVSKTQFRKLADYRNKLVHRPEDAVITRKIAKKYLNLANKAIYDLLKRKNPSCILINDILTWFN